MNPSDPVASGETPHPHAARRAAVVLNPAKITHPQAFRNRLAAALARHGWDEVDWQETTEDAPGGEQARTAAAEGAGLVVVAGGDGTVREVVEALAGTGVPMLLVPTGTTNLLARNLGLPLDQPTAIEEALSGRPRAIDVVSVTLDDDPDRTHTFAVMAGIGLDAEAFAHTNDELKGLVGHAAYLLAGLNRLPFAHVDATVTVDDQPAHRHEAILVTVGNVGTIQGGIEVLPAAEPDDGKLHIGIARPHLPSGWLRLALAMLFGRQDRLREWVSEDGTTCRIESTKPHAFEMDGDVVGQAQVIEARVEPGALTVMVPR